MNKKQLKMTSAHDHSGADQATQFDYNQGGFNSKMNQNEAIKKMH